MSSCVKCGHDPAAAVSEHWEFALDKRLTSANLRMVNAGASRWRYAKERDAWGWLVKRARRLEGITATAPLVRRRVTITRRYSGRCQEIDRDNLVAGVKPLVDALVLEGIARDDDAVHLELHVLQERGATNGTHVLVEELA